MATWAQLDQHMKPILIVNVRGFWDPLIALFQRMTDDGFLHKAFVPNGRDLPVQFCDDVETVIPTLREILAGKPREAIEAVGGAELM